MNLLTHPRFTPAQLWERLLAAQRRAWEHKRIPFKSRIAAAQKLWEAAIRLHREQGGIPHDDSRSRGR